MHNRMYERDGDYFFDGEQISQGEYYWLCYHYQQVKQQLAEHLKGQQQLVLTRRDQQTRVEDGTAVSDLTIDGGVAELAKFAG